MLLEPGPIEPVDVDAWTQPGEPSNLAGLAASLAADLDTSRAALSAAQATMTTAWTPSVDSAAAGELASAEAAHAAQGDPVDAAIANMAATAASQTGDLQALMNESADDIARGSVSAPDYVRHPTGDEDLPPRPPIGEAPEPQPPGDSPGPGGTVWDAIAGFYQDLLLRDGSDGEIQGWVNTGLSLDAIRQAFLDSDEYREKHPEG